MLKLLVHLWGIPVFCTLILAGRASHAQETFSKKNYPLTDFRQPLDILPPALAGSFGELRANHFHSGADFRTNQRTGYPVYAVADGYISRLRVQNSGFGLALYINHTNGFTSVYGHLDRFAPKIATTVKTIQYQKQSYEIDEFPQPDLIPVRKGDVIGYSGNTGSSGGPHLHFELRDTKTEEILNPQLLGIKIPDNIKPVISAIYVYRLNNKPFNEFTPKQYFQVAGNNGNYRLNQVKTILLTGEVGFGIVTTDRHNGRSGLNGVYAIELLVDGQPIYTSSLERFSFANSRAINSHIDYPTYIKQKTRIQKSFVDPGNPLKIYSNLVKNGRITFTDAAIHAVKYIVTDANGNQSTLQFNVLGNKKANIEAPTAEKGELLPFDQSNQINTEALKISLPKGTLYNSLNLVYQQRPKPAKAYSPVFQIQNAYTPLHTGFSIAIKADSALLPLKEKAVVVNANYVSQGGFFENGYVKASPRTFGSFFITVDTLAPNIYPLNIAHGKNMANLSKMSFKLSDNLSGIKSFNGYVDGKWILMEFDTKTATLWHTFDKRTTPGKHSFELVVSDMKNNIKKYKIEFSR